jgi:O-antigen/teichoic acid export membrane protein
MWYGVSSIAARFLNYLLTPYLTNADEDIISVADYGKMTLVYAAIPIINILFTYGMETTYFRFSKTGKEGSRVFSTISISLFITTILFSIILLNNANSLAVIAGVGDLPILISISIYIIAFDTLSVLPFSKLRQDERPIKFALAKVIGILFNVAFTVFFISYCPYAVKQNSESWVTLVYNKDANHIEYILWANLIQSVFTFLILSKTFFSIKLQFNFTLWKQMMQYAWPLVIVGIGAMINETFSRLMLSWWLPGTDTFKNEQVGIFNACYKLSILITLFIQAFKMGAEPFFFKQAEAGNPQKTYARVMKFFVIVITTMFLAVALFLPIWKHFIGPKYWSGLSIVPILLLANMFLGIYYNLSIWFKLGNKTTAGLMITLVGSAITLIINYLFIPKFGFIACAWATFFCYGGMMVLSYIWGQKVYPIPYKWKKLVAYFVIVIALFFVQKLIILFWDNAIFSIAIGVFFLLVYVRFLLLVEKNEFKKLPIIGKFIK